MMYQGTTILYGYSDSEYTADYELINPSLRNVSTWSTDSHYWYRRDGTTTYMDKCRRPYGKKRCKCKICAQLNVIQQEIFDKDPLIATLINKNGNTRKSGCVYMRKPMPILHFKVDHSSLKTKTEYFKR